MSRIKVNRLENTATGNGGIDIDASGHVKFDGQQLPTAGPLSNRNLVINGAMQVAQRGTTSTDNGYRTVDRWQTFFGGSIGGTQSQASLTSGTPYDEGFRAAYKIEITTASNNGSDYMQSQTNLEAQDIAQSGWNYKDPSHSLTCSFWVKSSLAGTYNVQYRANDSGNFFFNRPFTLTANTWTKVTQTIPGHASLVFNRDTETGLQIVIVQHYGTSHTDNSISNNTWFSLSGASYFKDYAQNFGNTANATFEITGVQLEVGDKATTFEHRSYGDELARCQRYYYMHAKYTGAVQKSISQAAAYTSSSAFGVVHFPVTMRAIPTLEVANVANAYRLFIGGSSASFSSFSTQEASENAYTIERGSLSMSAGNSGWFRLNDEPGGQIAFTAEL